MEDNHGKLRIIKRPRESILTPKLAITGLIPLVVPVVAVVVWKLINKDAGLFSLGAHEMYSLIGDILVNTSWYGIIFYTNAYLLLFAVMVRPRHVKIVMQRIIETFRNIRKNKPWRQSLFVHVLGSTVFAILVIGLNLLGAFLISLSMVQYPLHIRSSEDPTHYATDRRINKYPQRSPSDMTVIATVTRYNTEDVLLRCEFYLFSKANLVSVILQSLYWTTENGRRITETDKIHINNSFTETDVNRKQPIHHVEDQYYMFGITSVLSIEVIDDGDYDTYLCKYFVNLKEVTRVQVPEEEELKSLTRPMDVDHNSFHKYEPPEIQINNMEEMGLTEVTNSIFHLKKQEIPVKTAMVSPGGLFIDHAPYWSLADPGDIIINTTISGKDNADCCWLPIRLYKYFFGYQNLVWRGKERNQHQRYLIRQQCVCREDLVLYNSTVAFVRTRYNSTAQRQETFRVSHPRQVVLVPNLPHVFRLHQDEGDFFLSWSGFNRDCAAEINGSSGPCRLRFQYIDYLFNSMMLVDIFNWIFSFATTIIILGMCQFVTQSWVHCFIHVLPILDPPDQTEDYTYDLYLMYDEEDKYETQVAKKLRKRIEGPAFSVFDPWRDIAPGRSVPLEQEKAIEESRTFCVIISNSSENDDEQKFELVAIKKTLAARAAPNTDNSDSLFTIQIGECKVDSFLSPVKAIVPVNDREENVLDDDVLFKFLKWTLSSKNSWITMQRGGVEAVHQRLLTYEPSFITYIFYFYCNCLLCLYFLFVLDLDYPYKSMTEVRHDYFEAE